jgi:hypothetical protein
LRSEELFRRLSTEAALALSPLYVTRLGLVPRA